MATTCSNSSTVVADTVRGCPCSNPHVHTHAHTNIEVEFRLQIFTMNRLLCFGVGVRTACPAAVTGGSTVRAAWFTEGWSPDGAGAAVEAVNVKAVYVASSFS